MKLTLINAYKSISSFPETELPDFVILTGVNGAGKSHLLEAINSGCIQLDSISATNQTQPIRLFNWTNLVPNDSGAFASYQITQERQGLWNELFPHIQAHRNQITDTLRQYKRFDLLSMDIHKLINLSEDEFIRTGDNPDASRQNLHTIQNIISNIEHNLIAKFTQRDVNRQKLINELQEKTRTSILALEERNFYDNFPISWLPIDMFQQSFGRLFLEYKQNFLNNRLKELANSEGDTVSFLSSEEFIEQYGEAPWTFVNSILEIANLDFRINQPGKYYEDRPYEPVLIDQIRGTQVKFGDLSSGERILMSFALCLYYAEDRRQLVDYPKVLLFDEIDAPLHPSMTQSLLHTIQEVLVNRHGIKVIMTTHSPSTVALAPEASVYAMYKTDIQRLQKTTKDKALAILTTGVPTLSIDYNNRRQVFVESQYDVQFYEIIYNKLKNYLIYPEISINFISSGVSGQGNCDQVEEVVNRLYECGNRTVYGIIDWDKKNDGNERVKVLGHGKRYSIENYILDPLLLGAFLIREKWIERDEIGFNSNETYVDIAKFDNARLQVVANFIVSKVKKKSPPTSEENNIPCEYVGGQVISLPSWFLQIQGHRLEEILKDIFPKLKGLQKTPSQLKLEILRKVVDDIPTLIPKDLISLFEKIKNVEA